MPQCSAKVTRSQLSPRSASGTATRPRLRSRKNLGCRFGGDTQYVLYLFAGQPALGSNLIDWLPAQEQVEDIVDSCPAVSQSWLAEGMVGIDGYFGDAVLGKLDQLRVAVAGEVDPAQVLVNDLGEH